MINQIIQTLFNFFESLGIIGVFLIMLIENIGIPLPIEIGYLIGQNLINQGIYSYYLVLIVLTFGHLIGALIAYSLGRWGDNFIHRKLKNNAKVLEIQDKLIKWYDKYGDLTVFLTRFIGYVRPWSSFVAGFSKINLWRFVVWTFLGSLMFNISALYFSSIFIFIWRRFANLHFLIISIAFALFWGLAIYELYRYFTLKKNKNSKS